MGHGQMVVVAHGLPKDGLVEEMQHCTLDPET